MSKKQEQTPAELLGGGAIILVFILWLADWGPFGWFDAPDEPKAAPVPKAMITKDVSAAWCKTESNLKIFVSFAADSDFDSMNRMLGDGMCDTLPRNAPVVRLGGGFTYQHIKIGDETGWTVENAIR